LEERVASIIRVTRVGDVGTTIPVSLMMEATRTSKRRFLQEPHDAASQKTAFFRVTAVRTSNLTCTVTVLSTEENRM
jgi:hypothetical protein